MRELMLQLLCYEPYKKLISGEKEYIDAILSGNYNPPQAILHALFSGFYCCVQQGTLKNVEWLRQWKAAYGRAHLPLIFKKICFYLMVKGGFSESDFMEQIGLQVSRIRDWGISPQFRKYAEKDTYSTIGLSRNGVKKEYIVSTVKKLYYEAGRQVSESKATSKSQSMTLSKLPQFADVFAGSATVAASVVSAKCPRPQVNDKDPVMVCFAWAFTYHQKELRSRLAKFINSVMKEDFSLIKLRYTEGEYEKHYGFMYSIMRLKPDEYWEDISKAFWRKERLTNDKFWDNPWIKANYSKSYIARAKKKARRYKEFIIRMRSWYVAVDEYLKYCRTTLKNMDFSALLKDMNNNQVDDDQLDNILDYALAVFYYYSFKPRGKNVFHKTCVDENNYHSFLKRLNVNLEAVEGKDRADKAWALAKLRLHPASLNLEYRGNFSGHLRGATFKSEDFRTILKGPSDMIYYLDSPYFRTAEYPIPFSDKDHKDMLDCLRNAKFKWIFSMQYHESAYTNFKGRRGQSQIIKDYGAYYRGFCVPSDDSKQALSNLFVVLFDSDTAKKKKQEIYQNTIEMIVVNFCCLRILPPGDVAVVLPFDLFLQYANDGKTYKEIVQQAIDWRESNITSNYACGSAV